MGKLSAMDFGVFPGYLCKGKSAKEQMIICWIWNMIPLGTKVTLKSISEAAGCAVTKADLDKLVRDGVLSVEDDGTRSVDGRYGVQCELIREPEKAAAAPARDVIPQWVFDAVSIWAKYQGVIGPKTMHAALRIAVQFNGSEKVLRALEKYASHTEARFAPSPSKMVLSLERWVPSATQPAMRSMEDL